jgi:hypothetical protein
MIRRASASPSTPVALRLRAGVCVAVTSERPRYFAASRHGHPPRCARRAQAFDIIAYYLRNIIMMIGTLDWLRFTYVFENRHNYHDRNSRLAEIYLRI